MPRLYDIARTKSYIAEVDGTFVQRVLVPDHLPVFDVSSVHDFLCLSLTEWDAMKLCLAPPILQFWMEYTVADKVGGAMFRRWSTEDWLATLPQLVLSESESMEAARRGLAGVRWVITLDLFLSSLEESEVLLLSGPRIVLLVDFDGMIIDSKFVYRVAECEDKWETMRDPKAISHAAEFAFPMLVSISFIGDTTNLEEVAPTRQQRRYAERKHAPIPYTYHVLKVKVFEEFRKRYSLHGGGSHSTPRLHEVRANWAYYAPDRPLFGKVVGMVFRSSHLRGNPDLGVVEKEYEVAPALQSA